MKLKMFAKDKRGGRETQREKQRDNIGRRWSECVQCVLKPCQVKVRC